MTRAWLMISNRRRMVVLGESLDDLPGKPVVKSIKHDQVDVAIGGKIYSVAKPSHAWSKPDLPEPPKPIVGDLDET